MLVIVSISLTLSKGAYEAANTISLLPVAGLSDGEIMQGKEDCIRSRPVMKAASPTALCTVGKVKRPSEGDPKMSLGLVEIAAYSPSK